jgi:erythromycin esterase
MAEERVTEQVGDLAAVVSGWRERAIPLVSARPGVGVEDLRPLVGLIADAKVVGLGESSHGAGELFTMKHRLIEFLVTELGFTACAFEASHAGCLPIDDYVRQGLGEPATVLTGQGYTAWDTEEVLALLAWLRDHNADVEEERRVAFWGLDSGYNAIGRQIVSRYLDRTAQDLQQTVEPAFSKLDQLEPKWPFQLNNPDAEATLLEAHQVLKDLDRKLGADRRRSADADESIEIRRLIRMMRQWTGPDRHDRSRLMGENLLDLIDHGPADSKVVVWAHNGHIGRKTNAPAPNLGDVLTERYGSAYVPLALEFGSGTCHMRSVGPDLASADLVQMVAEPPVGSLPWCLTATGHKALALNLRDRRADPTLEEWLRRPQTEHEIGWTYADWSTFDRQTVLAQKYDGIIFVDTATPSHPTSNALRAIASRERY